MPTNATTSGTYNRRAITATLTQVLTSGTTLGLAASPTTPLWVYAIDSDGAGTMKLGVSSSKIDETLLQSTVAESFSATATSASPCVYTANSHGMSNGMAVRLTGTPPTGFSLATTYYVVAKATNTFQLAATPGGTAINSSSTGSGIVIHMADTTLVSAGVYSSVAVRCIGQVYDASLATPGTWVATSQVSLVVNTPKFKAPTIQSFTSGSGTYVTPQGALYIRVRMVGGGGGGSGSGTGSAGNGGSGGSSTFFNATAGGGGGGTFSTGNAIGGTGGGGSIGAGASGIFATGGGGSGSNYQASGIGNFNGGAGAGSAFAGGAPGNESSGNAGYANTGGGGSGGGCGNTAGNQGGAGGGSGAFIDMIIASPAFTYSYAVGAGGSAGTAGTSGNVGGTGGSGVIYVEEYYQ
jgi:hypothetical protein